MHIAIVTETWPPEVNGVALTVQSLALGLVGLGHEVEVVRPRQPGETDRADGLEHVFVRGAGMPRYPGLRFGLPAGHRLRQRWGRRAPQAVYIATEGPLGATALSAARALGIPASTGFHTRFDDFARHYGLGFVASPVLAYLRRFHNAASATLVPTRELADFLHARGFTRTRVLRRAVDTALFHPERRDEGLRASWNVASDAPAVICVGRIAAEKNLDLAVRAFRALQVGQPGARFIVVGDGPARAGLAERNPDFVFTGTRRGDDLARHYASADLFVFPSRSETFGNVTLEALASGVPVVAFDYAAAHEHIAHPDAGARIALDDDEGFVAAAVAFGSTVGTRRAATRYAARESVRGLDPATVARHFARILARLAPARAA